MQRVGPRARGGKFTPACHARAVALIHRAARWPTILRRAILLRRCRFWVTRFVLFSPRASVGGGPYVVEAAYPLAA